MYSPKSEELAHRVHRYYALVDEGDTAGVVGLFARDAVYMRPGYDPIVGRDGLDAFYGTQRVVGSGCHTITRLVVGRRDVAVEGEFRGRLKDGSEVDLRFADFFQMDEDLLFETRNTYFFAPMV
ncbi:nuclear transport factor 2 family protein [Streptomyces sp. NPDC059906]|uniref:nuclear transport factor 2 family protein n=1 Tax=Streptomyces sp. NPDC059906 TaxID=3346997 RepID=UPI0036642153